MDDSTTEIEAVLSEAESLASETHEVLQPESCNSQPSYPRSILAGTNQVSDHVSTSHSITLPVSAPVFDAWWKLQRVANKRPLFDVRRDLFKPKWLKTENFWKPPQIGMIASVVANASPIKPPQTLCSDMAIQRLRFSTMVKSEDQIQYEAFRKLKVILLSDPTASKLGRSLVSSARLFEPESNWESSFSDAFAGKAVATLAKRASSLWRFHEWCIAKNHGPSVVANERVVYAYMEHLKIHGSPTTADSFLQAWTFIHYQAGLLTYPLDDILSARVKGAAAFCNSLKRPLRQSLPLTVKMLIGLENIVQQAPYDHWRVIAGHMLLCVGSSSRFGDVKSLESLQLSTSDDIQVLEAESASFKTQRFSEKQKKLLPIISLGSFFSRRPWAEDWMELRQKHNLSLDPALPAFSEIRQEWLDRRMLTGEAQAYLIEFMESSGFSREELKGIGCHSLKCTLLSWVSKGNYLNVADRLSMGHHLSRDNQSAVVYARDELTRIQATVHQMLVDIKTKKFRPDGTKAERLSALINPIEPEAESDTDASDAGPRDVELARHPNVVRPAWDDVPLDILSNLRVHRHSGVVHVLDSSKRKFKCGRLSTRNFQEIGSDVNCYDSPICLQCRVL